MYKITPGISRKKLEQLIVKDVQKYTKKNITPMLAIVMIELSDAIRDIVETTNVWQDFRNHGPLWKRLGGGNLDIKLAGIVDHWAASISMTQSSRSIGNERATVYTFTAIKSDYSDVISLPEAYFDSESNLPGDRKGKITRIPWLEWLLKEGREYVVRKFVFTDKLESDKSRGGGLMIPKKAGGWRVPIEYAGTVDDNFLTRALDQYLDKAIASINRQLRGAL